MSPSADVAATRPFYERHADAYDALVADPVAPWVEAVDSHLRGAGQVSAKLLDAGCGTGRHAQALIDLGHRVTLLDAAPKLLGVAVERCPEAPAHQGDICTALAEKFSAITCRGVLNDLVDSAERDAAMHSFAAMSEPGGLLMLDVREMNASRRRADGRPHRVEVQLDDGRRLVFTSRPHWKSDRIVVEEIHELAERDGTITETRYTFTMRPWTGPEILARLGAAGFADVQIRPGVGHRTPDRLFVTARKP